MEGKINEKDNCTSDYAGPAVAVRNRRAEPAAGEQPAEGFFSWAMLATYAGATAATLAVTQVFKGVGFIDKIPTRIFSYVVALVLLLAATAFTAGLTVESAALCIINAVVVSLASNGAFDAVSPTTK